MVMSQWLSEFPQSVGRGAKLAVLRWVRIPKTNREMKFVVVAVGHVDFTLSRSGCRREKISAAADSAGS